MDDYSYDLGPHTHKITTASPAAQLWFARGLNWCFGFHHEEAIHCFEAALAADPDCAMAHWGIAYGVGPNYNFPWEMRDPDTKTSSLARAYDATQAEHAPRAFLSHFKQNEREHLPTGLNECHRPISAAH
jgi:hypothetical protein